MQDVGNFQDRLGAKEPLSKEVACNNFMSSAVERKSALTAEWEGKYT